VKLLILDFLGYYLELYLDEGVVLYQKTLLSENWFERCYTISLIII
jgi:hypothetical protein